MVYNFKKDYQNIFDTPTKRAQEIALVNEIMKLLNNNKFNNIYDLYNKNATYQDFLKNNAFTNVMKHFGNTFTEEDYNRVMDTMIKITEKKNSFDKENIKTTNIGDDQFVSLKINGNTMILDNSNPKDGMSIEREMEEEQKTQKEFQSINGKQNAEKIFEELGESKKQQLNLLTIKDINKNMLNREETELLKAAAEYQLSEAEPIKIDLQRKVIVNESNEIMKIEKEDNKFVIVGESNNQKDTIDNSTNNVEKSYQKTLGPIKTDSIYNNAA